PSPVRQPAKKTKTMAVNKRSSRISLSMPGLSSDRRTMSPIIDLGLPWAAQNLIAIGALEPFAEGPLLSPDWAHVHGDLSPSRAAGGRADCGGGAAGR